MKILRSFIEFALLALASVICTGLAVRALYEAFLFGWGMLG